MPYAYDRKLSPMDIDKDGQLELPLGQRDHQSTKAAVVQHVITHEMEHAIGINGAFNGHCDDPECVMYRDTINWERDWKLCSGCRAMILIHND